MSSGLTHAMVTCVIMPPSWYIAKGLVGEDVANTLAFGCLMGIPMSPDLDQEGISTTEKLIAKYTLGLGYIWLGMWEPYALIMPHRSPLSHWPILGTIIRLVYLFAILNFITWILWNYTWNISDWEWLKWFFWGLVISDSLHFLFDLIPSSKPAAPVINIVGKL